MRRPGPRAWTSVRATEPSSQTPGFAAVTQTGLDTTVLSVNVGRIRAQLRWREEVSTVTCIPYIPVQGPDPDLGHVAVGYPCL